MLSSIKSPFSKAKEQPENDLEIHSPQHELQPCTSKAVKESAVLVKRACKYYGTKNNQLVVLDELNMTVTKGTMYFSKAKKQPRNDLEIHTQHELQPCTSKAVKESAVVVKRACKYYGTKNKQLVVLDELNMTVTKGNIYGLLGASGCGKTTLLLCILGQRKLNSGEIWVFEEPSSTRSKSTVKTKIGYMPQEIALYDDFTIHETLVYFGWIAGMTKTQIEERSRFLIKLLELPHSVKRVKDLSGGEKRRVSLAATLLHEPELLILDEPTVGTDSLLREVIWKHLKYISNTEKTTIILTTHYIDEAQHAHTVALMRGGKLLAEDSPDTLLIQYKAQSLDDVFLKLSVLQNQKRDKSKSLEDVTLSSPGTSTLESSTSVDNTSPGSWRLKEMGNWLPILKWKFPDSLPKLNKNHMKALIWKNGIWWLRNINTLIFMLCLAVIVPTLCCIGIGREPRNIRVAVVNYETNSDGNCNYDLTCNSSQFSCNYLNHLKRRSVKLIYHSSEKHARESLFHGETSGMIVIKHNYSTALRARIEDWQGSDKWNIEYSNINIIRDLSDKIITNYLVIYLTDAFQHFIDDYATVCNVNPEIIKLPIRFENPVHGVSNPSYTNYVLSGSIIGIMFSLGALLTSGTMIVERNEASFERTFIMGISESELLAAHLVCEFIIMVFQCVLGIITAYVIFDTTYKGSIVLMLLLTISVGFCGMAYGIIITSVSNSYIVVFFAGVGSFLAFILVSGMIWPIEGMHYLLQPLSILFPLTKPVEGARSILYRAWDLSEEVVYMSFVSNSLWTTSFLIFSILYIKFSKN